MFYHLPFCVISLHKSTEKKKATKTQTKITKQKTSKTQHTHTKQQNNKTTKQRNNRRSRSRWIWSWRIPWWSRRFWTTCAITRRILGTRSRSLGSRTRWSRYTINMLVFIMLWFMYMLYWRWSISSKKI